MSVSPSLSRSSRSLSNVSTARRPANWWKRSLSLSDKVSVEVFDFVEDKALADSLGIDKVPAIAVVGAKDYGIRMFGIPSGYEFGSLIESIKLVSEGKSGLAPDTKKMVAKLTKPVKIQVFITPT